MQIAAADTGRFHLQHDFPWAWSRIRNLDKIDLPITSENESTHSSPRVGAVCGVLQKSNGVYFNVITFISQQLWRF